MDEIINGLRHIAKLIKMGWSKEIVQLFAALSYLVETKNKPSIDPERKHILDSIIQFLRPHTVYTNPHDIACFLGKEGPHPRKFDLDLISGEALSLAEALEAACSDPGPELTYEEQALAMFVANPHMTNKEIAGRIGCHPKSMSRWKKFKKARKIR